MIAVTCSACRLRFEASAAERRIHGTQIRCPACDMGEPIVLDVEAVEGRAARSAAIEVARDETRKRERLSPAETLSRLKVGRPKAGRLRVTPPSLDPTALETSEPELGAPETAAPKRVPVPADLEAVLARDLAGPTLDEIRGALPAGAPELPIYVEMPPEAAPPSVSLWGPALGSGAAVALLFFLAVTVTWQSQESPFDTARDVVAGLVSTPGIGAGETADDELTTASIRPAAKPASTDLSIARVATELAETDEGRVLSVRTDVHNDGAAALPAPRLRIAIRSDDGTVLHRWTAPAVADWIEPGETRAFTTTTKRIPEGAGDVKVDFATR